MISLTNHKNLGLLKRFDMFIEVNPFQANVPFLRFTGGIEREHWPDMSENGTKYHLFKAFVKVVFVSVFEEDRYHFLISIINYFEPVKNIQMLTDLRFS